MSPIVTMYIWYNKCRVRTEFMWDCFVIIQSQLWIIQTAVNFLFCWLLFVCRVNRTKSVIKREKNDSLLLFCWVWTDYVMFMCRQTGNLWFILIQKGREKKGWGNTLRQKGDFLGSFYSFSSKIKFWLFQIKAVSLHHENPPSLFTMLKSAGRFVLLWHIIQDGRGWETAHPHPIWLKKTPQQ